MRSSAVSHRGVSAEVATLAGSLLDLVPLLRLGVEPFEQVTGPLQDHHRVRAKYEVVPLLDGLAP